MSDREPPLHSLRTTHYRPSEQIVNAVAASSNTPPEELPPLFDTIDPDALDQLFHRRGTHGRIEFQYAGFQLLAQNDGGIELTPIDE